MTKDIVINDFQKGIADSPHLGFADMRNIDLSISGVARTARASAKVSSTTITDNVKWIVKNPTGNHYALGESGKLYKSSTGTGSWTHVSGNTTTGSAANGLAYWKSHIFVARNEKIDVLKCSDDTWYNDWQTLTSDAWHPMLVGQDDALYIGNARYVAKVSDDFAAGAPPTATFTAQALDLPEGYRVKCLAELGVNLMVGTIVGSNQYGGQKAADIFPWDRSSDSFSLPLRINDFGVHQMITDGNYLYVMTGLEGNLHVTNGTAVRLIRTLPKHLVFGSAEVSTAGLFLNFFPGAITQHNGRIFFGVSSGTTGANVADGLGVWSLDPATGVLKIEHTISTGTTDADNNLYIGALYSQGTDQLLIAWVDNTDEGIDATASNRITSYGAYFISAFIPVATRNQKRTFNEIEFSLAAPLATDQGIRISYRKNLSDAFTVIGTYTFASLGAALSHNASANIVDAEYVQLKVEIDSAAGSTPQLREVRLF